MKKKIFWVLGLALVLVFSASLNVYAFGGEGHFEKIKHKEFQSGEVTKIKDSKVIFPPNHIFDPETNTLKEVNNKKLFGGILLNCGKILSIEPMMQHVMEKQEFAGEIGKYVKERNRQIFDNCIKLSYQEKEECFLPYIKQNADLYRKYTDYKNLYEKSMYGIISDPKTGKYEYTKGKINVRRKYPHKILLDDGRVFIIGGEVQRDPSVQVNMPEPSVRAKHWQAELYNPNTGNFALLKSNYIPDGYINRIFKLNDNRFFIISGNRYLFYDIKTNEFSRKIPILPSWHWSYNTVTQLNDGRFLFFLKPYKGGKLSEVDEIGELSKEIDNIYKKGVHIIIIYDLNTNKFKYGGHLAVPRGMQEAYTFRTITLADGRVLIYGGMGGTDIFGMHTYRECSAEIYNPEIGKSKRINDMHYERALGDSGILMNSGKVLLFLHPYGGVYTDNLELYVPKEYSK